MAYSHEILRWTNRPCATAVSEHLEDIVQVVMDSLIGIIAERFFEVVVGEQRLHIERP